MRGRAAFAVGIAVTLAAMVSIAPSIADARSITVSLRGEATNGFRYGFTASSLNGKPQSATLGLGKGRTGVSYQTEDGEISNVKPTKGSAEVLYDLKRFRVTGRHVRADLGRLGEIDLRFRSKRKVGGVRECGFRFALSRGVFKGTIDFEGDESFATIDRSRVRGSVAVLGRKRCKGQSFPVRPRGSGAVQRSVILGACGPEPATGFFATRFKRIPTFGSVAFDRRPYASVFSYASTFAKPEDFQFTRDLETATFSPPGTWFVGSGTYEAGMTSGNLASDLPGFGRVLLVPGEAILTWDEDEDFTCPGFRGLGRTMPTVTADRVAGKQRLSLGFRHRAIAGMP